MKYTKANLAVREVAATDKTDVRLNRVHFESDGTTVATNGRAFLAVSPADPTEAARFPNPDGSTEIEPPENGFGLSPSDTHAIAKLIPPARTILQYARLVSYNPTRVALQTVSGSVARVISAIPMRGTFPRWRGILGEATRKATVGKICVDRLSLIRLLQAIEKACPDRGSHNPVWIEFGGENDSLVLRSENLDMGQRAMGIIRPLNTQGYTMEADAWEEEIRGSNLSGAPVRSGDRDRGPRASDGPKRRVE